MRLTQAASRLFTFLQIEIHLHLSLKLLTIEWKKSLSSQVYVGVLVVWRGSKGYKDVY